MNATIDRPSGNVIVVNSINAPPARIRYDRIVMPPRSDSPVATKPVWLLKRREARGEVRQHLLSEVAVAV